MNVFHRVKKWLFGTGYEVGELVYWRNIVDPSFTGVYVVTKKRDTKGYVEIYNEKKGTRTVPYFYLLPYDETHSEDKPNPQN